MGSSLYSFDYCVFLIFHVFIGLFFFICSLSQTYDSDHEDENEGKDKVPGGKTAEEVENGGPERYKGKDKDKEYKKDATGRDFKKSRKEKEPETSADSSGNWRNSGSSSSSNKKESDGKGGERQSAVRPRSDNNRAARRAEKR